MPKLSVNFKEILSRPRGNFEEQNTVLVVFHNINAYYIINANCNYYITNKGLFEEWDKKGNVELTGAATAYCLKGILKRSVQRHVFAQS